MASHVFSCFVDDDPILKAQAFIWLNCLKRLQKIDPSSIFVHATAGPSEFLDWLGSENINIIQVDRFDSRNKYCNKIKQLATFCEGTYDQIVFMDCDTAWIGKEKLPLGLPVSARIVDMANPPELVLQAIFIASGLGQPNWWPVSFPRGTGRELSDMNNCNGGLYICAGDFVKELEPRWRFWALWCLDNSHLFKSYHNHADQVSFALATRQLNVRVGHLPMAWNFPTHMPNLLVAEQHDISPQLVHYHRSMTSHLKLKPVGLPSIDFAIDELNRSIAGFISDNLLNSVFSDFRYVMSATET